MNKTMSNAKIERIILAHRADSYRNKDSIAATVAAVRRVMEGMSMDYVVAKSDLPAVKAMAQHSIHAGPGYREYLGILADEALCAAGTVRPDVEDYLNGLGLPHKKQGRRYLSVTLSILVEYPMWHEPTQAKIMEMVAERLPAVTTKNHSTLYGIMACAAGLNTNAEVSDWLLMAKRQLVGNVKPRGYIGRIHNMMLRMGYKESMPGFDYLRYAAWQVIRSGKADRRVMLKDLIPLVAKRYEQSEPVIRDSIGRLARVAAVGGSYSDAIFSLVDALEPPDDPCYQMVDTVLDRHGIGATRMWMRGYECIRTAIAELVKEPALASQTNQALMVRVDRKLGYRTRRYGYQTHTTSRNLAISFAKPYRAFQEAGSLMAFLCQMAQEVHELDFAAVAA